MVGKLGSPHCQHNSAHMLCFLHYRFFFQVHCNVKLIEKQSYSRMQDTFFEGAPVDGTSITEEEFV